MKKTGLVVGILVILLGLSVIFTPIRTYFLIGWMIGLIFLVNGASVLFVGFRKKPKNKSQMSIGLTFTILGIVLLVSDNLYILSQNIIVYLVAGGILLSGLIECFIGVKLVKAKRGFFTLLFGIISCCVGLAGLLHKEATSMLMSAVVGYFIIKIGVSIFMFARDFEKPQVIKVKDSFD